MKEDILDTLRQQDTNLREAIHELRTDKVIRGAIGEHIFKKYYRAKKDEWHRYNIRVSQWELEEYLGRY